MSDPVERWYAAMEPLPGIHPRIPEYVREAGEALVEEVLELRRKRAAGPAPRPEPGSMVERCREAFREIDRRILGQG